MSNFKKVCRLCKLQGIFKAGFSADIFKYILGC